MYLTAADLAKIYRVSRGTIYAWASQDGWRRTRSCPKRYSCSDAQQSYDRRRHIDTMDDSGTAGSANSPAAP